MQQPIEACTRAQSLTGLRPCATCVWLLHPAPTSAQDGWSSINNNNSIILSYISTSGCSTSGITALDTNTHHCHIAYFSTIYYIAMSVISIPTNDIHNNSFTDISTTMLWPSSEYLLSKSLRLLRIIVNIVGWNRTLIAMSD